MSTRIMTFDEEIDALKLAVGAGTDMDLADKLGLQRFAVSKWRQRESIPEKYRLILLAKSDNIVGDAMTIALRFQFFGEPERGRWLLVATAILPPDLFLLGEKESEFSRGKRIEGAFLRAMSLALHVSKARLKKDQLDDDDDCKALIAALLDDHSNQIARIVEAFSP